jgi:hypothetical protein
MIESTLVCSSQDREYAALFQVLDFLTMIQRPRCAYNMYNICIGRGSLKLLVLFGRMKKMWKKVLRNAADGYRFHIACFVNISHTMPLSYYVTLVKGPKLDPFGYTREFAAAARIHGHKVSGVGEGGVAGALFNFKLNKTPPYFAGFGGPLAPPSTLIFDPTSMYGRWQRSNYV